MLGKRSTMTFREARAKLKHHFSIKELLDEYDVDGNDCLIVVSGQKKRSPGSTVEAKVVRELTLISEVEEIDIALSVLPEEYRTFIDLRFNRGFSYEVAGRTVHQSKTTAYRYEVKVLSAFVSALGMILLDD